MEKLFVTFSLLAAVALSAAIPRESPKAATINVMKATPKPALPTVSAGRSEPVVIVSQDTLPKKKKDQRVDVDDNQQVEVNENISINTDYDAHSQINVASSGISTYTISVNGKQYDMVKIKDKITTLMIDGKEIPKEQFSTYQDEIDTVLKKIEEEHQKAEVHRKESEKHRAEADVMRKHADEQRLQAFQQRAKAEETRVFADQQRLEADKQRKQAETLREEAERHRANADKDRERFEGMQDNIINDLKEAGVIKSKVDLSYKFNENELVVNGEKQPEALHKRLRDKYMQDKNFEMLYNYDGKSGSTTGIHYKK